MLTGDIPAIRSILNLQSHACQYGCIHCSCKAVTETSIFGPGKKRTYGSSEIYALRTNASYQQDLKDMVSAGTEASYGVKGESHLLNLIKVLEDVVIDYFHTVLLGPFKENISRIVSGYLSLDKDKRIVKIPRFVEAQFRHFKQAIEISIFPSEFKRQLKPLTLIDSFKGSEWKNLMLYAMPTVMSDICNVSSKPLYLVNLCLASAVIILMKDNVSAMEIKKSQEQLYQWYNDRTAMLGNDAMTLKAHQITHMAEVVERHGSLCRHSCFFGEGLGYNLTQMISLKTLDKSLSQLKTRLADFSLVNAIEEQTEKNNPRECKQLETRMCVRDFCQYHFDNFGLEVQELSECNLKGFIIKPAYDLPFSKDSFVAYKCNNTNFNCAIGVVKSVVSINENIYFILKPLKIKSTILDKFSANVNDNFLSRIRENTMYDYYYCLQEFLPKQEMTSYKPESYFAREKSHLIMTEISDVYTNAF